MTYQVIKKSKGKEYLCDVESYRENGKVRQRIIKYYGTMDKKSNQLIHKQDMNLEEKIEYSLRKIDEFYQEMNGKVYLSFSGGKDSTVLLDMVRSLYPDVKAVFVDTGLEYPEVRDFVKSIDNVIWLKPEMNFKKVLEEYGYPVVSKLVSRQIYILRNPTPDNEYTRNIYLNGYQNESGKNGQFKLPEKWKFLLDAPFKINSVCCRVMKHDPIAKFEQESGLKPFVGTMANDSFQRKTTYLKTGCNTFGRDSKSRPLSIWTEMDVWNYIEKYNLKYSSIYDCGLDRTGCIYCMYGMHRERNNRFDIMKQIHPELYEYCMNKLGLKEVLDYLKQN